MGRAETQRAIFNSQLFWGLPTSSSWPECGASSPDIQDDSAREIDDSTSRVMAYSDTAGVQYIDRLEGELLDEFKVRIDAIMSASFESPTNQELL